jgi:hypothetical protein
LRGAALSSERGGQFGTLDRIAKLLAATLAIDPDELERLVQAAHETERGAIDTPPEPFAVSRQALRMFWRFRLYLGGVSDPLRIEGG